MSGNAQRGRSDSDDFVCLPARENIPVKKAKLSLRKARYSLYSSCRSTDLQGHPRSMISSHLKGRMLLRLSCRFLDMASLPLKKAHFSIPFIQPQIRKRLYCTAPPNFVYVASVDKWLIICAKCFSLRPNAYHNTSVSLYGRANGQTDRQTTTRTTDANSITVARQKCRMLFPRQRGSRAPNAFGCIFALYSINHTKTHQLSKTIEKQKEEPNFCIVSHNLLNRQCFEFLCTTPRRTSLKI